METRAAERPRTYDTSDRKTLADRYRSVRRFTERICEPLGNEDYVVQSMPDASPAKWHIAHVTWFFETFVLAKFVDGYESDFPHYDYLFNSYYVQAGERFTRSQRGLLSRPGVDDVFRYRKAIDNRILELIMEAGSERMEELGQVLEIGFNHEQQHQELLITDLKHMFSVNPLNPEYESARFSEGRKAPEMKFVSFSGGLVETGHDGSGFCFDNELPRHKVFLEPFELASRLITNREYMVFMEEGGYRNQVLWLSDAWSVVEQNGWDSPLYWIKKENGWYHKSLYGLMKVHPEDPVTHISFYEADAYARWAGARLPREAEWETACESCRLSGQLAEQQLWHPLAGGDSQGGGLFQMYGTAWEWTQSPYSPYPGYKPLAGALGEYNGKFMANQFVLRGGSCATSGTHIRSTYRNFFHPHLRWQFTGIRLAR
jgi:ergothioneine biosynthesis protein EgtB